MLIDKEYRFKYLINLVCFYVISILVNIISKHTFINSSLFFSFITIVWTISVSKRVVSRNIRTYMIFMGILMILLILMRACKYQFFVYSDKMQTVLWYLYYVPMVTIPFLSFNASLKLGKKQSLNNKFFIIFSHIPLLLIITAILTNDVHHKAFIFKNNYFHNGEYSYGPVYYIAAAWIVILLVISFLTAVKKCSLTESRKYLWLPLIPAAIGITYFISYPFFDDYMKLPEMFCATIAGTWEGAICIGLIPSNVGYIEYFRHSCHSAQILDYNGNTVYRSENARELSKKEIESNYIDSNTILKHTQVFGGKLYWTEDISQINILNQKLDETSQRLAEERDLIEAENKLKAEIAQTSEKNRIYDKINSEVEEKINTIATLVNEAEKDSSKFTECFSNANLLTAYIKRKSNLMLHASQSEDLSAHELILSIHESLEYLKSCGVNGLCVSDTDVIIPGNTLVKIYDYTENVIEFALYNKADIFINISSDNDYFYEKIIIDSSSAIELNPIESVSINSVSEDNTLYITLKYRTDGDCK